MDLWDLIVSPVLQTARHVIITNVQSVNLDFSLMLVELVHHVHKIVMCAALQRIAQHVELVMEKMEINVKTAH